MTESTLRKITGAHPDEIEIKKNYYLRYYDADASNLEEAMESVERGLEDLKAFLLAIGTSRSDQDYQSDMFEVLDDFEVMSDTYLTIATENPYVLPTIVLGVEAEMMSAEYKTKLFKHCDLDGYQGDEEEIIISPPLTGPSPERIQQISEIFKEFNGVDLPKGDINTVLTSLFNKMRIPIVAQPGKPVILKLRQFLDTLAVHFVGESREYRCPHLLDYRDEPHRLNPKQWCMSCPARMTNVELLYLGKHRTYALNDPVPPRDVAYPEVAREICNFFDSFEKPRKLTFRDSLKELLSKCEKEGGKYGAPKQPGDDLLACPNDGKTPAPNLTASRTISSPPNAERPCAEASDAGRSNPKLKLLEQSNTRKRNATEAQIESQESLAPVKSSNRASDEERLSAAVRKVVHPEFEAIHATFAAFSAKLESIRISERQSSAEAGPQTCACGEGGAPDSRGASSQGPQRSAQRIDGRIGGSERSDVAGEESALLYNMCRALLDDRQKWHEAHRTPSGN